MLKKQETEEQYMVLRTAVAELLWKMEHMQLDVGV